MQHGKCVERQLKYSVARIFFDNLSFAKSGFESRKIVNYLKYKIMGFITFVVGQCLLVRTVPLPSATTAWTDAKNRRSLKPRLCEWQLSKSIRATEYFSCRLVCLIHSWWRHRLTHFPWSIAGLEYLLKYYLKSTDRESHTRCHLSVCKSVI